MCCVAVLVYTDLHNTLYKLWWYGACLPYLKFSFHLSGSIAGLHFKVVIVVVDPHAVGRRRLMKRLVSSVPLIWVGPSSGLVCLISSQPCSSWRSGLVAGFISKYSWRCWYPRCGRRCLRKRLGSRPPFLFRWATLCHVCLQLGNTTNLCNSLVSLYMGIPAVTQPKVCVYCIVAQHLNHAFGWIGCISFLLYLSGNWVYSFLPSCLLFWVDWSTFVVH